MRPDERTPKEKLELIFESKKLAESEFGEFLRSNGIRKVDLDRWEAEAFSGMSNKIQSQDKEIHRKGKALAEAVALLVFQKKPGRSGGTETTTHSRPKEYEATGPNQVWSWDITYLPSSLRGTFFYLCLVQHRAPSQWNHVCNSRRPPQRSLGRDTGTSERGVRTSKEKETVVKVVPSDKKPGPGRKRRPQPHIGIEERGGIMKCDPKTTLTPTKKEAYPSENDTIIRQTAQEGARRSLQQALVATIQRHRIGFHCLADISGFVDGD